MSAKHELVGSLEHIILWGVQEWTVLEDFNSIPLSDQIVVQFLNIYVEVWVFSMYNPMFVLTQKYISICQLI